MIDSKNNDIYDTILNDSSKSVKCRVMFYFMKNTENNWETIDLSKSIKRTSVYTNH